MPSPAILGAVLNFTAPEQTYHVRQASVNVRHAGVRRMYSNNVQPPSAAAKHRPQGWMGKSHQKYRSQALDDATTHRAFQAAEDQRGPTCPERATGMGITSSADPAQRSTTSAAQVQRTDFHAACNWLTHEATCRHQYPPQAARPVGAPNARGDLEQARHRPSIGSHRRRGQNQYPSDGHRHHQVLTHRERIRYSSSTARHSCAQAMRGVLAL